MLKRYLWIELLLGTVLIVMSFFFDGVTLFALGGCAVGFAAQCSAYTGKFHAAAIALGIFSLGILVLSCVRSFFSVAATGGYNESGSSLWVPVVLAVLFLVHSFLGLPVEDRSDLEALRRGVRVQTVFCGIALVGILLNYVLSYLFRDVFLSNMQQAEDYFNLGVGSVPAALQDFHYIEGVIALALCFTAIRAVVRAFMGKEPLDESEKEIVE